MSRPQHPPSELLAAFRALEAIEHVAVLMVDEDSWDAEAMRVLSAFQHLDHRWEPPSPKAPDGGRPTARAWNWLCSGWALNLGELASAANVSEGTARAKLAILRGNRLVYPDGGIAKAAQAALRSHVRARLIPPGPKRRTPPAPKDDGAN